MAQEYSFDVVSQFDRQELVNAVNQAQREIVTRYDFKDTGASIELGENDITLHGPSDFKMKAMLDVLQGKLVKRQLSLKIPKPGPIEPAAVVERARVAADGELEVVLARLQLGVGRKRSGEKDALWLRRETKQKRYWRESGLRFWESSGSVSMITFSSYTAIHCWLRRWFRAYATHSTCSCRFVACLKHRR